MDFSGLPPEVNSARIYAGAGAGPLLTAASGWDRVAGQLGSAAEECQAVVSQLTGGPWRGAAAAAMAAAVRPYLDWLRATAARAAQTAVQARSAAAAYRQALAATVPPSAVAANRAALTSLVATNVMGQNTVAIAANQAEYEQMWAQDAAAMHSYAASSAAAATLPQFAPPPTTDQSNPLLDFLNSDPVQALETFYHGTTGFWDLYGASTLQMAGFELDAGMGAEAAIYGSQAFAGVTGLVPALGGLASASAGGSQFTLAGSAGPSGPAAESAPRVGAAPAVSAGLGRAMPVGRLSVPPSWGTTSAGLRLAATMLSMPAGPAGSLNDGMPAAPGGWLGGIPPVGGVANTAAGGAPRLRAGSEVRVIPRLAREGTVDHAAQRRARRRSDPVPVSATPGVSGGWSGAASGETENAELAALRKLVAELTERHEAATRRVAEAIEK